MKKIFVLLSFVLLNISCATSGVRNDAGNSFENALTKPTVKSWEDLGLVKVKRIKRKIKPVTWVLITNDSDEFREKKNQSSVSKPQTLTLPATPHNVNQTSGYGTNSTHSNYKEGKKSNQSFMPYNLHTNTAKTKPQGGKEQNTLHNPKPVIEKKPVIPAAKSLVPKKKPERLPLRVYISGDKVNFRNGPGVEFKIIARASKDTNFGYRYAGLSKKSYKGKPWYKFYTDYNDIAYVWSGLAFVENAPYLAYYKNGKRIAEKAMPVDIDRNPPSAQVRAVPNQADSRKSAPAVTAKEVKRPVKKSKRSEIKKKPVAEKKPVSPVTKSFVLKREPEMLPLRVYISGDKVDFRKGPGMEYKIIAIASKDTNFGYRYAGLSKKSYKGKPWYKLYTDYDDIAYVWSGTAFVKNAPNLMQDKLEVRIKNKAEDRQAATTSLETVMINDS